MSAPSASPPRVLAIAGSDSGGGAGIQADLKALAGCGVHGMTAITAITAQNTVGVRSVHFVPSETIVDQVRAVAEDIGVDAVKIGMLGTVETIAAVDAALDLLGAAPVVLDPVMVAESGAVLLDEGAGATLRERLLPRATVVTPNVAEAVMIAEGGSGDGQVGEHRESPPVAPDVERVAHQILALGPSAVVVTGGHREEGSDVFFDGTHVEYIPGERHPGGAAHGSGCTHSSALAAQLALGASPLEAARMARIVAGKAVRDGLGGVGSGTGPVDVLGVARRASEAARQRTRRAGDDQAATPG